jgi:hypothetical protein
VKINERNTIEALIGRMPVLCTDLEEEFVKYCHVVEHKYYGLRTKDVKHMACSLAVMNGVRRPF